MVQHILSTMVNIEVRHVRNVERLRNVNRMSHYRMNTLRWKIKNDLDLWEREEKSRLNETLRNELIRSRLNGR